MILMRESEVLSVRDEGCVNDNQFGVEYVISNTHNNDEFSKPEEIEEC